MDILQWLLLCGHLLQTHLSPSYYDTLLCSHGMSTTCCMYYVYRSCCWQRLNRRANKWRNKWLSLRAIERHGKGVGGCLLMEVTRAIFELLLRPAYFIPSTTRISCCKQYTFILCIGVLPCPTFSFSFFTSSSSSPSSPTFSLTRESQVKELEGEVQELKNNISQLQLERTELITKVAHQYTICYTRATLATFPCCKQG